MKRINVMVSDESKEKLLASQKYRRFNTQDETVDTILRELIVPKEPPVKQTQIVPTAEIPEMDELR